MRAQHFAAAGWRVALVLGRLLIPHSSGLPPIHESEATGPFEFSCRSAMCSPCSCVLHFDSETALAFPFEHARLGACPSQLLCFLLGVPWDAVPNGCSGEGKQMRNLKKIAKNANWKSLGGRDCTKKRKGQKHSWLGEAEKEKNRN